MYNLDLALFPYSAQHFGEGLGSKLRMFCSVLESLFVALRLHIYGGILPNLNKKNLNQ
jgi:hypothetical protein